MSYAEAACEAKQVGTIEGRIRALEERSQYLDEIAHKVEGTFQSVLTPDVPSPPSANLTSGVSAVSPLRSDQAARLDSVQERLMRTSEYLLRTINRAEL